MNSTEKQKFQILANIARSMLARKAVPANMAMFNLSNLACGSLQNMAERSGRSWVLPACQKLVSDALKGVFINNNIGAYR